MSKTLFMCLMITVISSGSLWSQSPVYADLGSTQTQAEESKQDADTDSQRISAREPSSWRFAGLPLVGYNVERGLGGGAYLAVFKKRDLDEGERGVSYNFSLNTILLWTVKGYQNHRLIFDVPYLNKDGLRLQTTLRYEKQDDAWHSGVGSPITLLDSQLESGAYLHGLTSIWFVSSLTQPLARIHPALAVTLGLMLRDVETSVTPQSILAEESPLGMNGGLLSQLQGSVSWDTRDRDPDTHKGLWVEASVRGSHPNLLSKWSYLGFNLTYRHYLPLLNSPQLIYAHRFGYDEQLGDPPYFQRNIMGGTQWVELGGNSVLRSYKFGRFRPLRSLYWSQELRARIARFNVIGRSLDILFTPLVDIGYFSGREESESVTKFNFASFPPSDPIGNVIASDWIWGSAGGGLRFVYDEGIVIRADVMWAYERFMSDQERVEARPQFGMFIMTGHSF